jgi:hypothetical protein
MITALHALTREYFEDDAHTPLDYSVAWIERGRTLVDLAKHITTSINGGDQLKPGQFEITRHMLASYLDEIGGEGTSTRLQQARRNGAHGMVEEGLQTLEDGSDDRDVTNHNERALLGRERLAAIWNKEFAKQGNNTSVFLSFGQMHLDALRSRTVTATATISQSAEGAEPTEQEDV